MVRAQLEQTVAHFALLSPQEMLRSTVPQLRAVLKQWDETAALQIARERAAQAVKEEQAEGSKEKQAGGSKEKQAGGSKEEQAGGPLRLVSKEEDWLCGGQWGSVEAALGTILTCPLDRLANFARLLAAKDALLAQEGGGRMEHDTFLKVSLLESAFLLRSTPLPEWAAAGPVEEDAAEV